MPRYPQEAPLVILLRQCYRSPRCFSGFPRHNKRLFTTVVTTPHHHRPRTRQLDFKSNNSIRHLTNTSPAAGDNVTNVAILGGGISGLTAASKVTKWYPNAKVTLYESGSRLGGWVRSEVVDSSDGPVVFEQGPRTLRPHRFSGNLTLNLAKSVGLEDDLLFTSKMSPAASNRFIYYPDHLVKMPSLKHNMLQNVWTVLKEPLFKGALAGIMRESAAPSLRKGIIEDESIGQFLARRARNKYVVDNIASAVMHGVYAGDVNELSARSLMPTLWNYEYKHGELPSILLLGIENSAPDSHGLERKVLPESILDSSLREKVRNASVYTFKNGMQTLPEAMAREIGAHENVEIKLGTAVASVEPCEDEKSIKVSTFGDQPPRYFSNVISTLPAHQLRFVIAMNPLRFIPYTTVMVVNLYYTTPNLAPEPGFGYLIPQSVPFAQNPEFALGVVYDSDATPGIDASTGTKFTVMLGGHYWDQRRSNELPSSEEGIRMAERVLERHLKITEKPDKAIATLHKNCIPQYTVGHHQRLTTIHKYVKNRYGGRLSVAGAWINGVGLNDCVESATFTVAGLADGFTGLESAVSPRKVVWPWKTTR